MFTVELYIKESGWQVISEYETLEEAQSEIKHQLTFPNLSEKGDKYCIKEDGNIIDTFIKED